MDIAKVACQVTYFVVAVCRPINKLFISMHTSTTKIPELRRFASHAQLSLGPNYADLHLEEAAQLKHPLKASA